MFRTIAVGSMCVALAALGAARSRAADEANPADQELVVETRGTGADVDELAVEQAVTGKAVVEGDGRLVEIQIGGDSENPNAVRSELRIDGQGTRRTTLLDKDGKVIERRVEAGPNRLGLPATLAGPQTFDSETRAALEKLIEGLEEESKKLQAEGKVEEAQKKTQSLIALKQLLAADAQVRSLQAGRLVVYTRRDPTAIDVERRPEAIRARQAMTGQLARSPEVQRLDALKRLAARRQDLTAELAKLPEDKREERAVIAGKIAELERLIAEEKQPLGARFTVADAMQQYRYMARTPEIDNLQRAIEKLDARRRTLGEQLGKVPESSAEERAKYEAEIANADRTMAELKYRLAERATTMPRPSVIAPNPVVPPGVVHEYRADFTGPPGARQPLGVPVLEDIPHLGRMFRYLPQTPELLALTQKMQALKQATDALAQAGLEDQARELRNSAEKVQKELERLRAERAARPDPGAPMAMPIPPHELHRSIRELTEQVQQLRKEVAEVRELLQRRP